MDRSTTPTTRKTNGTIPGIARHVASLPQGAKVKLKTTARTPRTQNMTAFSSSVRSVQWPSTFKLANIDKYDPKENPEE